MAGFGGFLPRFESLPGFEPCSIGTACHPRVCNMLLLYADKALSKYNT